MRIIAGSLGGRRLRAPKGGAVRPTYDRVRESLFGILEPRIGGARVLDLYAGSGSLGIECLSRGAECAVFVERDRSVMEVLRSNVEALDLSSRSTLVQDDVGRFLARRVRGDGFDLVFADPPYGGGLAAETIGLLGAWDGLRPGATTIVEHGAAQPLPAAGRLRPWRSERYGSTVVDLFLAR